MSRGLGKVERQVLTTLESATAGHLLLPELAARIAATRQNTQFHERRECDSCYNAVARATRSLERRCLVHREERGDAHSPRPDNRRCTDVWLWDHWVRNQKERGYHWIRDV